MFHPTSTQAKEPEPPALKYPYLLHRTYLCGHPDEFIKVSSNPNPVPVLKIYTVQHTYLPPSPSLLDQSYKQTLERCPLCARQHQAHKAREKPREPVRSLEAHRGEVQARLSQGYTKDGFLQALARYRFQSASRVPVAWKDEGPDDAVHNLLKEVYGKTTAERDYRPHAPVPYGERSDKYAEGPGWPTCNHIGEITRGEETRQTYTIQVEVYEALIPSPPPPEPQRHSDSALLNENRRAWPGEENASPIQASNRDSASTSLSFGDQPRNRAQFPSRTLSARGRGGQPLPILRNRRDMLKERIAAPSPRTASPQVPQSPQSPRTPRDSDGAPIERSPYGSPNSGSYGAGGWSNRGSQEGVHRQGSIHRSPNEQPVRHPYEYVPHSPQENAPSSPLGRAHPGPYGGVHGGYNRSANEDAHWNWNSSGSPTSSPFAEVTRSPYSYSPHRVYEDHPPQSLRRGSRASFTHRNSQGSSNRRSSDGAHYGSAEYLDHRPAEVAPRSRYEYAPHGGFEGIRRGSSGRGDGRRRAGSRPEPSQYLQPDAQDEDSDSDASSVGRW
ncbi:hypothetical protein K458DRAFT_383723 [Lentithecium fluviatile CBS 122367]|uniref:Uncharacterized protein n=1 Tax=Lentithecium fluviatile CBS 122367 TaxID=1168545 RepID=A0A6G1JER2_9PLEO|nr:hypothetical protein K458DRAFT_383723 [Lentithecium fluviatile CBS 122367]